MKSLIREVAIYPLRFLGVLASGYAGVLERLRPGLGYLWQDMQSAKIASVTRRVTHELNGKEIKLDLYTPNAICRYRAESFSSKEPETLEWIDKHDGVGPFFDIGANVGLYSLYYAATKKKRVYAFEPSFFNLAVLAKNVFENNLHELIKIVPNPLTETNQFANFALSTTQEGGALSAFGVDFGYDGKPLDKKLSYQTLGASLDFLFETGVLTEYPELIKIDVDGIEHLILKGARKTLNNPSIKSVLIEVSEGFEEQAESVNAILKDAGFDLVEQRSSSSVTESHLMQTWNQIWERRPH